MIVIELPIPPRCLSPNGRAHWGAKHRAAKQQRHSAKFRALETGKVPTEPWTRARVHVAFYDMKKHGSGRDADNALALLKSAFDGLVDAEIVRNDVAFEFAPVKCLIDKADPRVVIGVEQIGGQG